MLIAASASAQFVADDFHACDIDTVWTFHDAVGDGATATIGNAYTDDAQLWLSVPGGVAHEIWNTTVGAARVTQPVANTDFVAEVKFDSILPANFGQEGIVVRQDDGNWLRLEFYRDQLGNTRAASIGGPTNVFNDVALPNGTTAPLYMRVERVGDTWTHSWSTDGTAWNVIGTAFNYVIVPGEVGVYAGNRGATPPAHTVHVDYFTNTAGAPVGEDTARNTLTVGIVGGGLVERGPDLANYACGEPVTVTAVDQPGWAFAGWTGDYVGLDNPAVVTMDGPVNLTATFVAVTQYTLDVTVVGGGSVVLAPAGGIYNEGTLVTVTAVDAPGQAFTAWTGDLTGSINPAVLTMDGNKAVTADFATVAQFTLTADVAPGTAGTVVFNPAGGTYNAGTAVTVTAAADPGWGFDGWSGDLAGTTNPEVVVMDAAKAITANFSLVPEHTLTVSAVGQGTVVRNPDLPTYLSGSSVELTALPDPGWQFDGWSGDLAGTATPDTIVVDGDKVVTATFSEIPPIIVTDDFNRCDLGPLWTVVDPYGDGGTAEIVNAYTDSARVAISVPGGFPHEIWAGVIGATHILQPSPDIDFVIEAKFDGDVPTNFGQEGIVVKQDEAHWVRAEFFRDNLGKMRVAVDRGPAQLTHDVYLPENVGLPLWMRLERVGDTFTQSWSEDGVNFTVAGTPFPYEMTVTETGLFAGNRGPNPPAHTVLVDYISNTAAAPVDEDITRAPLDVAIIGGGGLVTRDPDLANYACGQLVNLTAVDQPGWAFAGWSGDVVSLDNPLAVTMAGALSLTATFVPAVFHALDVVTVGNGSVELSPAGGLYNDGTTVTVTAVPDFGWEFAGWTGDLVGSNNPESVLVDGAKSVTATFTEIIYAFESDDFNACELDPRWTLVDPLNDGGTATVTGTYTDDAFLALSTPGNTAHELWNGVITAPHVLQPATDVDFTAEVSFASALPSAYFGQEGIIVKQDDAIWLRLEFFSAGGITSVFAALPDGQTTPIVQDIGLNRPLAMRVTRTGDIWDLQWSADGTNWTTPAGSGFTYAMNVTEIGLYAGNTGDNPPHTVLVDYFSRDFGSWIGEDADRAPLTTNVVGNGTILPIPDQASYGCGEEVVLTAVGDPGWGFTGWTGDVTSTDNPVTITMGGPRSVTATFAPLAEFNLTVTSVGGSGTVAVSPPAGPYYDGSTVILTAVDGPGWGFSAWSGDLTGSASPDTIVIDGDKNITATFVAVPQFTLTATAPGGNGNVVLDPAGGTYNQGKAVILTAVGDPGWGLDTWAGDLTGSANPDTLIMDGDKTVTAAFAMLPQFTLTLNTVGGGTINDNPPGGINYLGAAVELTAVPDPGWQFDGWSDALTGSANPDTLTITGDLTVTATFSELPPVFQADDFSVCGLAPIWTFVDPYGDGGTATIVNAYTDDAQVAISVPGGAEHEIWDGMVGAPHILQPALDQDFLAEVKFDSTPPIDYGQQGIVVTEDTATWVRAEFYRDQTGDLHIALVLGPAQDTHDTVLPGTVTAPIYMRLARTGDSLVQSWSEDGTTWNTVGTPLDYPMNVGGIGVYAGNRGNNAPAHTVLVDYFTNSAGAPAGEDTARNQLNLTVVGGGTVDRELNLADYGCGDVEVLTAVDQPGWIFSGWTGDVTGLDNPLVLPMDGSLTLTATFTAVAQYTLATNVSGGSGNIVLTPAGGVYNEGTVVTVEAVGDLGWGLDSWGGDLTGSSTPEVLVIDGDKSVSASFVVLAQYTLDHATIGNGTVTVEPDLPFYYDGDVVVLTATPDAGWLFGGWSGGLSGQASPDTLVIDADHTITATFVEILTVAKSDDFNGCTLDPMWTVVDPFNDGGTATILDPFTDNARVAISVPGGSEHEIWNGVIGATHILQPAEDIDFMVEAKFDSDVPADFGQEGILIKESETSWVRAEFFRDEFGNLRVAVDRGPAQLTHDVFLPPSVTAPIWMRVARAGNTFTQYWSADGVNWTVAGAPFPYTMTVTEVGLFAGNRDVNPPAHTVEVDYFASTPGTPVGEDIERNDLTLSVAGSGAVNLLLGTPEYTCGDVETLTAVADPGSYFAGWSGDLTGTANPILLPMDGHHDVTATFLPLLAPNQVVVSTGPGDCLSTVTTCLAGVPVRLVRNETTGVRSFSLTLTLTDLVLCDGVASIVEGDYLNSIGATDFQVLDNLDGSFEVSGTIVGEPCGATAADGVLFTVDVAAAGADGTGSIGVGNVDIRDCSLASLTAAAAGPALIPIDTVLPAGVTNLATAPVVSGNPSSGTLAIDLSWSASVSPDAATTLVYRKGFGSYPEFSDAGGTVPVLPIDPVAEGWQLAATLSGAASAYRDVAPNRDYWYYHLVVLDDCANPAGSAVAVGGLNYLLADIAGGTTGGNNAVNDLDVARLTAAYGSLEGQPAYVDSLDIGPTGDFSISGLPTTDNAVDFEDLMVFGLSYGLNVGPGGGWTPPVSPAPAARNFLILDVPALPAVGQTFAVTVMAEGDGTLQGLSVPLTWNNSVVTPQSVAPGALLSDQGGNHLVFMPQPGQIDVALLGIRERGIAGTGALVTVTFQVVGAGSAGLDFGTVIARDQSNQPVDVFSGGVSAAPDLPDLPSVAALHQNSPNPFNPQTTVSFDVARAGRVRLSIYGIDGRLVRTLVDESLASGRYARVWDGSDEAGRKVASGVYLMRMVTPEGVQTKRMALVK